MSDRAVRTTLELTLNTGYVKTWGVWEAIRELLQNTLDAQDRGYDAKITYVTNTQSPQLRIINEGITIDRDTLLLGTTSKDGDSNQRGKFGEGMKLSLLVLTRSGYKVKVRSGSEQWVPKIEKSANFADAELLKIDTSPCTYRNSIQIDIIGVSKDDWDIIQSRMLFLTKPKSNEIIDFGRNKILMGENYTGKLFVKGIYVGKLPGIYYFGYDLADVNLDRDRRLADPYDLKYEIRRVLDAAIAANKIKIEEMINILNGDYEESNCATDSYRTDALSKSVAEYFTNTYGENAVPVSDTANSIEAKAYGFDAIVVSKGIKDLIERETESFDKKKENKKFSISKKYSATELSEEEIKNFEWAFNLIKSVETIVDNLTVVDFVSDSVAGLFKGGDIFVSKKYMNNKAKLIEIVIHEAAHHYGEDGSREHENAQHDIAARLIVKWTCF